MRWTRGHRSNYVEDRRGQRTGRAGLGGALTLFSLLSRFGLPGMLIGGVLLFFVFGRGLLGESSSSPLASAKQPGAQSPEEDTMVEFVSFVLDDTQATWAKQFAAQGARYQPAHLVLFRDGTSSSCGYGQSAMGPFYCGRDRKVYIDLSFYDELRSRFGAPGDFAQAYVIAHEIGHHVQRLLGTTERVMPEEGAEGASVRVELQADCFAGVWAHDTEQRALLEQGDIEEALRAAAAIGDDRLQRASTGRVMPESFTHGTSEQRMRWFKRGFQSGSMEECNTFDATRL